MSLCLLKKLKKLNGVLILFQLPPKKHWKSKALMREKRKKNYDDPVAHTAYLAKKKARYQERKAAKKIKTINDLTDREKRSTRHKWKEVKRMQRSTAATVKTAETAQKDQAELPDAMETQDTPDMPHAPMPVLAEPSRQKKAATRNKKSIQNH